VPLAKLLLGVPFYGRSFDCGGLGLPFTACTDYSYTEAMGLLTAGWTRIWDATARVPWLRRSDSGMIVSYDDTRSVGEKCDYVKSHQAAGIIIWELSEDYRNGTSELLAVVGQSFAAR
jgi:chitinase